METIVLQCKMCMGTLRLTPGSTIAECEYCGTRQTVPVVDDEKKPHLFDRANQARRNCDFDNAAFNYETIIAEFPKEAEAYWGLILCKYGIEYVDDPVTSKKIPTCHRLSFDSVLDDADYKSALENADASARAVYEAEAKQIEAIRKGILEVSEEEEPYDIFICFKDHDDKGDRTPDSVLAEEIYNALTAKGYRVFFSRISLEDKLGAKYEPYIFAALNSAKIMLAFGTSTDYYNAVWVKNEWSRFLELIKNDKKKVLIPCYADIEIRDLPEGFSIRQSQNMAKLGWQQDLLRGIEKILPPRGQPEKDNVDPNPVSQSELDARARIQAAEAFMKIHKYRDALGAYKAACALTPQNYLCWWGQICAITENFTKKFEAKRHLDSIHRLYESALAFVPSKDKGRIEQEFNAYYQPLWDKYTGTCNTLKDNISSIKDTISQQNKEITGLQTDIKTWEGREYHHWGCSGGLFSFILLCLGLASFGATVSAWYTDEKDVAFIAGLIFAVVVAISILIGVHSSRINSKINKKEEMLKSLNKELSALQDKKTALNQRLITLESELVNLTHDGFSREEAAQFAD